MNYIEGEKFAEEVFEYTRKYMGTDKYNDVMLALQEGFRLAEKYNEQ